MNVAELLDSSLPEFPCLASWVIRVDHEDGALALRSQDRFYVLAEPLFGKIFDALAPGLDGSRRVGTLLESLPEGVLPTSGVALLRILRSWGLLLEGAPPPAASPSAAARELLAFLGQYDPQPHAALARLADSRVLVFGAPDAAEALREELCGTGIDAAVVLEPAHDPLAPLRDALADGVVHLLLVADPVDAAAVNRLCVEGSVPALYLENRGREAVLGPLVLPGESACRACLDERLATHLALPPGVTSAPATAAALTAASRTARSAAVARALYAQASLEAARFVAGFAPAATIGNCFWLSASSPATERRRVLRVPTCPACARRRGRLPGGTGEVPREVPREEC